MGWWLMTLMLVMLSSLATRAAEIYVRMGNVQGSPGERVTVPIYVDCDVDMRAFEMYFSTDLGVCFSGGEFSDRVAPSSYNGFNINSGCIVAVGLTGSDDVALEAGNGLVAEAYLDIPDDAQPGAYTMFLRDIAFIPTGSGGLGSSIYLDDVTATLTVIEGDPEPYACYTPSNTTLTFYYDNQRSSRPGTTYDLNTGYNETGWLTSGTNANVTKVVFDPSFTNARPTSTFVWFYDMRNLQSITGISYLNTSEVTNMSAMFYSCESLTSLDLSSFNTAKVTSMQRMFNSCYRLTSLDLSNFNTANVTSMEGMFGECFSLTSLDVSSFNTAQVTNMQFMFYGCESLTTIYAGSGWSTDGLNSLDDSYRMFYVCTSLVGGMGTTYDANHVDAAYAHIDGGPSNPGYFTAKSSFLRGDVNGDGQVKIGDVTALINYLLSHDATGINLEAADTNQSGGINISDVTALVNYLLSGSW